MRWVVAVLLVAGCFSKPGLRDRDAGGDDGGADAGGSNDGGGDGGGSGDGGVHGTNCSFDTSTDDLQELDLAGEQERGPWMSPDKLTIIYVRRYEDSGTKTDLVQRTRNSTADDFMSITTVMANASFEADPFVSDDGLRIWYTNMSGGLEFATRGNTSAMFANASQATFQTINVGGQVEGPWLSPDEKAMLFVRGPGYDQEDLFLATRTTDTSNWMMPTKITNVSVSGRNECCPTAADGVILFEHPLTSGKQVIAQAAWDGAQSVGTPQDIPTLGGSDSYQQPHLVRDGSTLIYVLHDGATWSIHAAARNCP